MSNLGSILEGGVVGVAVGGAAAAVVEPALEPARQEAEKESQARILNLAQLAQLVAQSLQTLDEVLDDAHRNGYHDDQLAAAVQLALRAPSVAESLTLFRRATMQEGGVPFPRALLHRAYAKAQIEAQYWPALDSLADLPLDPSIVANAIVRGHMAAPFPLPYTPPAEGGAVQDFPKSNLSAEAEASASGINVDRLLAMVAVTGRPMAPEEAAKAEFRGIIEHSDYQRAILEGDIRGEWGDAIHEYTREIITAHDAVELRLRGWLPDDQSMYELTSRHGMSTGDTDLLFKVLGRPISYRNVFLGERRGGVYNGSTAEIEPSYLKSLQESNLRPEWYNIAWALRFTVPNLFFVRQWLKDGHDHAQAQTWLYHLGYEQADIDAIIATYGGAAKTTADPSVRSAVTAAYTALRRQYVNGTYTDAQVTTFDSEIRVAEAGPNPLLGVMAVLKAIENPPAPVVAPPQGG